MIMNYINKIKTNITINTNKKTSNLLDGSYVSIYKGRSMNFEDLREYVVGDNIKDIDWKASARSRNLLVRRYIAEKKHNVMLVFDTGKKMIANTKALEVKKDVALYSAGTLAYLANKNGDYVSSLYNNNGLIKFFPFRFGLYNIENILSNYDNDMQDSNDTNVEKTLDYISKFIKRRMIIFIITDISGMEQISEVVLKKLTVWHDIMLINISDADITGKDVYDIDESLYIPEFVLQDKELQKIEERRKREVYINSINKFKKYGIITTKIDSTKEIPIKIIDLLERHKYGGIR